MVSQYKKADRNIMAKLVAVSRIVMDDGRIIEVTGDEVDLPDPGEIHLNSMKEFKEDLSTIEQGILQANNSSMERIAEALLSELEKKNSNKQSDSPVPPDISSM